MHNMGLTDTHLHDMSIASFTGDILEGYNEATLLDTCYSFNFIRHNMCCLQAEPFGPTIDYYVEATDQITFQVFGKCRFCKKFFTFVRSKQVTHIVQIHSCL